MLVRKSNLTPLKLVQRPVRSEPFGLPKDLIIDKSRFKQIVAIILKVNPASRVRLNDFRDRLIGMLIAAGVCDDHSVYTKAFREYAANQPKHAARAKEFRAIAAAEDPLAASVCSRMARSELNNAARRKWHRRKLNRPYPLRGADFELLTQKEQAEVRQMAVGLAEFTSSYAGRSTGRTRTSEMCQLRTQQRVIQAAQLCGAPL